METCFKKLLYQIPFLHNSSSKNSNVQMFVIIKCSNNKINYKTDFDYLQYKQGHGFPAENIAAGVFSYPR